MRALFPTDTLKVYDLEGGNRKDLNTHVYASRLTLPTITSKNHQMVVEFSAGTCFSCSSKPKRGFEAIFSAVNE